MKAKKWITFITAGVSLISISCAIIATCKENIIVYDVSMAIFGSALLGFIMSLIEYFAERRFAMQEFLKAALQVFMQLRKIKYIEIEEPRDLVLKCLIEDTYNGSYDSVDGKTNMFDSPIVHKNRDAYIAWIKEKEVGSFVTEANMDYRLLQIYNKRIGKSKKVLFSSAEKYVEVSKVDFDCLSDAYCNLDFLFSNRTVRKEAFDLIYSKLQEYRNKIKSAAFYCDMFREGKCGFAVWSEKIMELNDFFFTVKKEVNDGNCELTNVYQEKFDDVSDKIEEFRAKMYFKKDVQYEKRVPVLFMIKRIEGIK